jgi:fibronectin type 3 domain-containing protein
MRKLLIVAAILLSLMPVFGQPHQQANKAFTIAVGDHKATLTWNASTSTGVVGYKVYRSTVNGGPYTIINTLPSLTYTDHQVNPGTTYYYVVTAYDNTAEGNFSTQVSGTIPQ